MVVTSLMAISRLGSVVHSFTTSPTLFRSSNHRYASTRNLQQLSSTKVVASQLNAVSAKQDEYTITVLPGDGIGPEITKATNHVLDAICSKFGIRMNRVEMSIGGDAIDKYNDPFPAATYEQCVQSDSILLACIGGYKWDTNPRELRPESGLLRLRQQLGLYANLRPAKVLKQLIDASTLKPSIIENVDIMVVRELTGDVYFGTPKGIDTIDGTCFEMCSFVFVRGFVTMGDFYWYTCTLIIIKNLGERVGYNNMIYKESEIVRIARVAGTVASQRGGKLCSVDKANVLDVSQLWREVVTSTITTEYPNIDLSHMYVDNAAMQLIRYPQQFDTIVCGNIFGDILSDEASMLVGSLGMLPSASLGEPNAPGVFEPCHGSAPDIANTDKANPLAMILSAAMMLQYDLLQTEAATLIENAVSATLDAGFRTMDIKQENDNCQLIGCQEMGQKVADYIMNADISTLKLHNDANVVTADN